VSYINYSRREVNYKIVYCGPGLSGKTTNILQVFRSARPDARGRLVSLYAEMERTLYFDFLPINLGEIRGFHVRLHLYSVPGQVCYSATRQLVFRGADGAIFVADSAKDRMDANLEAVADLQANLDYYGIDIERLPYALQLNKRDLEDAYDVDYMIDRLRLSGEPVYRAIASENQGVQETLKDVAGQVLHTLSHEIEEMIQV
jgi:signal recognition particle receptor subunit beta